MSQQPREIVVLLLRDVIFKHIEYRSLEEYLIEKYGFREIKEKKQRISEDRQRISLDHEKIVFEEEAKSPVVLEEIEEKVSALKVYEGEYLDARVSVYVMGNVVQREDIVMEAEGGEQYLIYTSEYQMIKLVSESGYSLQQLVERLTIDLGLSVKSKEWVFHRSEEG